MSLYEVALSWPCHGLVSCKYNISADKGAAGGFRRDQRQSRDCGAALLAWWKGLEACAHLAVDMNSQQHHDAPDATNPVYVHAAVKVKSRSKMASHHLVKSTYVGFAHDCFASDLSSLTSTISLTASSRS